MYSLWDLALVQSSSGSVHDSMISNNSSMASNSDSFFWILISFHGSLVGLLSDLSFFRFSFSLTFSFWLCLESFFSVISSASISLFWLTIFRENFCREIFSSWSSLSSKVDSKEDYKIIKNHKIIIHHSKLKACENLWKWNVCTCDFFFENWKQKLRQ